MKWSRQRLTELLVGIQTEVDPSIGHVALRELKDLQGEVHTPASPCMFALSMEQTHATALPFKGCRPRPIGSNLEPIFYFALLHSVAVT